MTRPSSPSSIYFDSNALITLLQAEPGHELVVDALNAIRSKKIKGYISAFSYVEVRGYRNGDPDPQQKDQAALALLDSPSLIQVEFSRGVAIDARRIAFTHRLDNVDAIHVACAAAAEAEVLFTSDQKLVKRERIDRVWICEPYELGEPALFGSESVSE